MEKLEIHLANQEYWQDKLKCVSCIDEIDGLIKSHSDEIQNKLINNELKVIELRVCVNWVKTLDGYATSMFKSGELIGDIAYQEFMARRIAHQAGNIVLNKVKSRTKYDAFMSKARRGII